MQFGYSWLSGQVGYADGRLVLEERAEYTEKEAPVGLWNLFGRTTTMDNDLHKVLIGLLVGLSLALVAGCSPDLLQRPARVHHVTVDYEPLLARKPPQPLPPVRLVVLRPVDKRPGLSIDPVRGQSPPLIGGEGALIGFHGLYSQDGHVTIGPPGERPDLGVRRRMDAGMQHPPDIPKIFFTFDRLPTTVQTALATYFRTAGIQVTSVASTLPGQQTLGEQAGGVQYALGCTIEEFSLLSLRRYQQFRPQIPFSSRLRSFPVRGPTRATVSLTLTLYHLPSDEVVWQENVWDITHDPPRGESRHRYGTVEETLSVALSHTVESVLATPGLQAVLQQSAPTT